MITLAHTTTNPVLSLNPAHPEVINRRTMKGQTPLFLAVVADHVSCVQCLLEKGANPVIADKDRETPLYKGAYLCIKDTRMPFFETMIASLGNVKLLSHITKSYSVHIKTASI